MAYGPAKLSFGNRSAFILRKGLSHTTRGKFFTWLFFNLSNRIPRRADPYSRLRVPKYQKVFEALFFAIFLGLYYAVLVERNPRHITTVEVLLYLWIAAFAYEEFGEFKDAGTLFYAADFWSLWDIGIIGIGVAYLVSSRCFGRLESLSFFLYLEETRSDDLMASQQHLGYFLNVDLLMSNSIRDRWSGQ